MYKDPFQDEHFRAMLYLATFGLIIGFLVFFMSLIWLLS